MQHSAVPLLALLPLLGWTGCSKPTDAEGPHAALERYFAAARTEDWEALHQVVSSEYRQGRSPAEFGEWARSATPDFVRAMTERTLHEIAAVHVDGDTARIEVRLQTPDLQSIPGLRNRPPSEAEVLAAPLTRKSATFDLLREEGEWRIMLALPPRPDPGLVETVRRASEAQISPPDPAGARSGQLAE